ncbi:hypothetical protein GCM10007164_28240 [Luteimonas padinae]|nr:hypothetical protein GCM10007164_28240 [Luteimonas padinae]
MASQALYLGTVLLAAVLGGCASAPAGPCSSLGTSACGDQAANVARDVAGWHNAQHPTCPYVRPISAEILRRERGSVVEHWKIEACDAKEFTYRAYLMPSAGALTVMVSDVRPDDRAAAP